MFGALLWLFSMACDTMWPWNSSFSGHCQWPCRFCCNNCGCPGLMLDNLQHIPNQNACLSTLDNKAISVLTRSVHIMMPWKLGIMPNFLWSPCTGKTTHHPGAHTTQKSTPNCHITFPEPTFWQKSAGPRLPCLSHQGHHQTVAPSLACRPIRQTAACQVGVRACG